MTGDRAEKLSGRWGNDEPDTEPETREQTPNAEPEESEPVVDSPAEDVEESNESLPWAVQRDSVKSGREMVQFFLQADTQSEEREFERDVEDAAGYDVLLTDLREAAYLVAMNHPDEVAEILDEWGCEFS